MDNERFVPQIQVRSNIRSGATQGGGYIGGVWYPDMSGVCGGATAPPGTVPPVQPPPSQGGGWVGGVWFPDQSGVCV